MARVKDVAIHLDNCQARFMVFRYMEDLFKLGHIMPVGFRNEKLIYDKLTEEGDGRRWDNNSQRWVGKEGKKHGLMFTLT